ncbi:hypothetical protein KY290_005086 [Solanum tuberosum]|uniref:DUF4283 domain-containing protein n=1 Tax=Solanum tuberosum TaxID=4113 RepID=A0ABQ7WD58_SOLTU|nr:hypothetical protein KY290_005086 [Solanum tuberosum]
MLSKDLAITANFHQAPSSTGMATTPPVELLRLPDQLEKMRSPNTSKTQQVSSSYSSYNSSKLRREEAIHIIISEREFDWLKKLFPWLAQVRFEFKGVVKVIRSPKIYIILKHRLNPPSHLREIEIPFLGDSQVNHPNRAFKNEALSKRFELKTSMGITPIAPANHENEKQREEECLENNNRNVQQRDVERAPNNLNVETRANSAEMHTEHRDERLVGRTVVSLMQNVDEEIALNIAGRMESSHQNQVGEVSKSTNFSFQVNEGEHDPSHNMEEMQQAQEAHHNTSIIQDIDTRMKDKNSKANKQDIQGNTSNRAPEKQQTAAKEQPGITSKTSLINTTDKDKGKTHLHENANKHPVVNKGQVQVQTNGHPYRFNNQYMQHSNKVWQAKEKQQHPPSKSNAELHQPGNGYPKVSSNFEPHNPNQRNRLATKPIQDNEKQDQPNTNVNKKEHIPEPSPYTVVRTYAARLRHNQSKFDNSIKLTTPEISTKQGLPAVLFVKEEVLGPLAETCKYTLIGKFSHTMPKVDLIRKSFILQTQLSREVKISHYNARHVYIDLDNELDYNTVWTKQRMNFVDGLLIPVGKVLYLDSASIQETRGSKAKVKVQIDISKKRHPHVWMGYKGDDLTDERWQTIEY